MKHLHAFSFSILILASITQKAFSKEVFDQNTIQFSPLVGYNFSQEVSVFGAMINFEHRFSRHWGITSGVFALHSNSRNPEGRDYKGLNYLQTQEFGLNLCAKYHIGWFSITAGTGREIEYLKTTYTGEYDPKIWSWTGIPFTLGFGFRLGSKSGPEILLQNMSLEGSINLGIRYSFKLSRAR